MKIEEYINKVIEIAKSYKGTKEGKNNFNIYGEFFDKELPTFFNGPKKNAPYCMIYVLFCFVKAFGDKKTLKMFNLDKKNQGASCNYVYDRSNKIIKDPCPGCVVFFNDKTGKICHVGLCIKIDKTHLYTMEGNKSDGLTKECKYPLNSKKIYAYIMPDYSILADTEDPVKPSTPSTPEKPKYETKIYKVTARSGLNLRLGPSTKYHIKTVLFYKTKIKAIDKGDWLLVKSICNDLDDTFKPLMFTGYVYKKYTKEVS